MTPDVKVKIAGVEFENPIMTASGCSGYGKELSEIFPLSKLGALVTKSITLKPRLGHPSPRTAECHSGMLNAIGLANVGIDNFIADIVPFLKKQKTRIIVNVAGASLAEYVEVSSRLNDIGCIDMIELNISCPNVNEGGMEFGANASMTENLIKEIKKVYSKPVIAKLSPNVTSIVEIAKAAEAGGADVLSLINTLRATGIDVETWRPKLTFNKGGLSGPAVKPVAVQMVNDVYNNCSLPIIGLGGISSTEDAVEFFLAGAAAVQVGTALFIEPDLIVRIVKELKQYLKRKNLNSINDLIGKVRKY